MSNKKQNRIGVVLLNMGGPTSVVGVRHFLENLFGDQDIINIGGGKFQERIAKIIARYRYKKVAEKYKEINGCPDGCTGSKYCTNRQNKIVSDCCSPINSLTELQRRTLEKKLKANWPDQFVKVYTAMRYWLPFDYDVFKEIYEDKIEQLVLLPLYPQFSYTTTGSSFRNWETIRKGQKEAPPWNEYIVNNYHLNEKYLACLNDRIEEGLNENFDENERNKVHLIFTAHGTPLSEVEKGDPYTRQIRETAEGVMNMREQKESWWLSYQSRVGPSKWTQPNTEELVFKLLDYGVKYFLLIPIAFVTDHIETLHELNIELREAIEGRDYKKLAITKGLNDHPLFMQALQDEISLKLSHIIPDQSVSKEKMDVS